MIPIEILVLIVLCLSITGGYVAAAIYFCDE